MELLEPTPEARLGSDLPQAHPAFDAFGYAPFAKAIAVAVQRTPSPKGLVMAIDGPWGTGKTSLLNFIRHYLSSTDSESADKASAPPPVLVDFNPWWFSDREQLATQFLSQFRTRFPTENAVLMDAANALADYADAIGTAVSSSISAGAGFPIPLLKEAVAFFLKLFRRQRKDVQTLKADISDALEKSDQRFVVFVDDIDRLTPEDMCEVFKVIKAVADFPNVIYILAFDRRLVSESLQVALGINDGHAYLEKIVQVQFALPAVSRGLVLEKFVADLERLFGEFDENEIGVDPTYWANVLHDGISPLIETPRDVVRAVNALLVTFPGLRGEVNPVDFIALECLRVFVPDAYQFVRDNKDRFTGLASERGGDRTSAHDFYERWLNTVDERYRDTIKALFRRLFPRMQAVWGNMYYSADSMRRWGVEARICHPDKFDRYFQFSVPPHELSERDIREFITLGANVHALADAWIAANDERRPTGTGKANELIAALIARDDLPVAFAKACLKAFFRIGDGFVGDARNSSLHFFSIRPEVQAYWLVQHLTKMLPEGEGELLIEEQIRTGDAIVLAAQMAWSIARMHQPDAQERDSVFQAFAPQTVEILKLTVVARVRHAAKTNALEWLPDIHFLLRLWQTWGSDVEVKAWFARILNDDRAILRLLVEAVQVGTEHTHGDRTTRRIPSMNTKIFEGYLSPPVTLEEFSARIRQIGDRRALTADEIEALEVFENGMQMVRDGRNPSDPFARLGL
ncbi:KAP family P-loop domain-containing protein [Paraburkholderia steynii]|uniref:KAP family P-loop domain-containing protein n=1 Tax=Paraburkholderia steynii TaxID=1245441 RepID=A0A7Z7BCB2_9BURK|nr:P-loop NTPase fold protein [Paraburkholderia steynii]SDI70210.1 KAP family P-loop domain-containing protein [Paraburkholderia steynii]